MSADIGRGSARKLCVLYVGALGPTDTSLHRCRAIERLGYKVIEFDTRPYTTRGGAVLSNLRGRTLIGPTIWRFNRDLLAAASHYLPDIFWFDKANFVWGCTVRALRGQGIFTVHFNIDNPFGPRKDPGWRLVLDAVPEYDLHLVQREINLSDYRNAGARDVRLMRTSYEETVHFPPPLEWSDRDRINDVVYIGSPHDDRAQFLTELLYRHGVPVRIWGSPRWAAKLSADAAGLLLKGSELWNGDYREALWRSRICLAWVTHSNCDDVAHKSFEIAACGSFLLAEDTLGHRAHFVPDKEAVFFRSVDDCAAMIRRYLPDEIARTRIARAGRLRAERSGYGNVSRLSEAFAYIQKQLAIREGDSVRIKTS